MQKISVNFDHLSHLTETIMLGGRECSIVHIYSEYPEYDWVDASQEGIACVDDVARAAVIYIRYFEITADHSVLERIKKLLNFVRYMQTDDGEFYNFIDADFQINREGRTSQKSFNFWAARGYWALGFGYKIFKGIDVEYATILKNAYLKCKIPFAKLSEHYGQFTEIDQRKYPRWLINEYGTDASAEFLLGVNEFLSVENDGELQTYAQQLIAGILAMQVKEDDNFQGAFLSWQNYWHAWGNAQTHALASLNQYFKQPAFIKAAKDEADNYYTYLLIHGLMREWQLNNSESILEFPQIAYDIRCISLGYLRLAEATGEEDYAKFAGLAASWLMGNNAAFTPMYDSATGRCFDGIVDSTKVNRNSGAESTIEALYTMIEILNIPIAKRYITCISSQYGEIKNSDHEVKFRYRIFVRNDDSRVAVVHDMAQQKINILEDQELMQFLKKYRWSEHAYEQ